MPQRLAPRASHVPHGRYAAGFTLIEVMIALFVIALGIGALLVTITASADNIGHLRSKSFAEWVALNRISEVRLALAKPAVGVITGNSEFAGTRWQWKQTVSDPGQAGILRIDVAVASLADAYGFIGTAVAPPSGVDPDWSLQSNRQAPKP
jgi:general secretion pathway protein I